MSNFALAKGGKTASLYIDKASEDYKGLSLIAETFISDVKEVTELDMPLVCEVSENCIVAGSIGHCDVIDSYIADGKLDVSDIKGKYEVYKIEVVEGNLVVVGSEKIAAIYGLFHLSEKMGVSPWIYWGDVKPAKKEEVVFENVEFTSKVPSVKYRGFFMNDEWPCLGNFVMNTFGDFNAKFYRKVFELLLRLKGNYFWPAMWSASFPLDGGDGNPLGNMELADALGLTTCFSHHEPMTRASEEWDKVKSKKNGEGYGADWNYYTNGDGLYKYWEDGLERDKHLRNMITIGMRGERDTSMLGPEATVKENVELLKRIIADQQNIIKEKGCEDMPQMLALYKEVEGYYYGSKDAEGLCQWDALNPVTLLLSDDNFGNVRTLPTKEVRDRKAGWGLYYHFDYHGAPISYEWVSSMPLQKTWEQVTMAYDYGIRDLWIVNVGDLRPQEIPLSYFMNLAYDFEEWGTNHPNRTREFLEMWVEQQFGAYISDKATKKDIADVIEAYTRMHGNSKPEATHPNTYHVTNYNEAKRKLTEFNAIIAKAEAVKAVMPAEAMDAYYSMIYFPSVAGANLQKANVYAALNQFYAKAGANAAAMEYKELVDECIKIDTDMTNYYHETMADGKWKGMMLSAHFCFENWNDEGWHYPETVEVNVPKDAQMYVHAWGADDVLTEGTTELPTFTNVRDERYTITLANAGKTPYDFTTQTSDFIRLSSTSGTVEKTLTLDVTIDWDKVTENVMGDVVISAGGKQVKVVVNATKIDAAALPEKTFVLTDDVVSMEAEHFCDSKEYGEFAWKKLDNYGKTLSSMKIYPTTMNFDEIGKAPALTYRVSVDKDGDYTLRGITAPTNNLEDGRRMRYAVSVDGSEPVVCDTLAEDFFVGAGSGGTSWAKGVLENCHTAESSHHLTAGIHEITIYGVDAGLVLQKLVLYRGKLKESFFGPEESPLV